MFDVPNSCLQLLTCPMDMKKQKFTPMYPSDWTTGSYETSISCYKVGSNPKGYGSRVCFYDYESAVSTTRLAR